MRENVFTSANKPSIPEEILLSLEDPKATVTFEKGRTYAGAVLHDVAFSPIVDEAIPDWETMKDVELADEPAFVFHEDERGLRTATGILVEEPDGRVWIYEPKNHFGGYEHTFPKGRPEKGLTLQQTARKEVLEETGLLVEITGYLGDYAKTTTKTRYYRGRRVGGDPGMADSYRKPGEVEEVWTVKLAPAEQLERYLNTTIDQQIVRDLLKKREDEKIEGKKMEIQEIIEKLLAQLPEIGRRLITAHLDKTVDRNTSFHENPDDPQEHKPEWHQWGIVTHSKETCRAFRDEFFQCLDEWEIREDGEKILSKMIDGRSKKDLLFIAAILHDLGKFSGRTLGERDGKINTFFVGHEKASGDAIRSHAIADSLKMDFGLTDAQIEYVARCAELHYEFAKVRDVAKKSPLGYSLAFAESEDFKKAAKKIRATSPDFAFEIGAMYLIDSLAKAEFRIGENPSDEEIEDLKKQVAQKGLHPTIVEATLQLPVHLRAMKSYFQTVCNSMKKE